MIRHAANALAQFPPGTTPSHTPTPLPMARIGAGRGRQDDVAIQARAMKLFEMLCYRANLGLRMPIRTEMLAVMGLRGSTDVLGYLQRLERMGKLKSETRRANFVAWRILETGQVLEPAIGREI